MSSGEGYSFYGHGIYIEEKNAIFITRVTAKTGLGHLVGYNPETYEIQHDYQVTPGGLHECRRLPDGNLMVSSSGIVVKGYAGNPQSGTRQAPTGLVTVDVRTGKVLRELPVDDPNMIIGHFDVTRKGQILALSGPAPQGHHQNGNLYYSDTLDGPLRKLEWPVPLKQPMAGEMLSVTLSADQTRAAVTCPVSGIVAFVDMNNGRITDTKYNGSTWVLYDEERRAFLGMRAREPGGIVILDKAKNASSLEPPPSVATAAPPPEIVPHFDMSGAHAFPVRVAG